jgi:hypothetical protein
MSRRSVVLIVVALGIGCVRSEPAEAPVELLAEPTGDQHARLVGHTQDGRRVLEHTFARPYWGEPLRLREVRTSDGSRLVRIHEHAPLGWPAFGACVRLEPRDGALAIAEVAEPGRDGPCPAWADPLFADVR